jgi:NADPH:quinone reductase-like Zn-dependent oxidoreductase
MKRAVQDRYQEISGMRIEEVPVPRPEAGQILVRVEAVGVNPVDWKLVEGYFQKHIPIQLPYTPGCDLAGVVEAVGEGVEEFHVGQAVFGCPSLMRGGGFAEYAVLLPSEIVEAPGGLSLREAAALPVAAITAYDGLFVHGGLEAGEKLLVLGGAGGVGSAAIQMARAKGAEVWATASGRNQEYLAALGAKPINYEKEKPSEVLRDADMIFDCVGGEAAEEALPSLRRGGRLVTPVWPPPAEEVLARLEVRGLPYGIQPNRERLEAIREFAEAGQMRLAIEKEYGLAEIVTALEASKSRRTRGKILVRPGLG